MVNRIGASAAVLRRSIDRLWEDQSIESCDDWVIAYIGDLLATNLVNSLDARGQRLDVANTVYYRQRKGTLAILEEIAFDITGWNARVVEFFRRMGRTRHSFDPPIGFATQARAAGTQSVATGDGATKSFAFKLLNVPLYRSSVQVVLGPSAIGGDDGKGALNGSGGIGLTGTIDYGSGTGTLTFAVAPANHSAVSVNYDYLSFDSSLQIAEGIVGSLTGSQIGGWANLRNWYGAGKAQTAFDEFSHTADFRLGVDKVGWQNISHLGVFLWRLDSFGVGWTTPVASTKNAGQYSFDPTGREIPLFAAAYRNSDSYGDNWVSPQEWQLPGPISLTLMQSALEDPGQILLYATSINNLDSADTLRPNSVGVYTRSLADYSLIDPSHFLDANNRAAICPEIGCFQVETPSGGTAPAPPFFVTYNYGFSSTIGAGPYDRRLPGVAQLIPPSTAVTLNQVPPTSSDHVPDPSPNGWVVIEDSLTYTKIDDITNAVNVTVQAAPQTRAVLRWPAAGQPGAGPWTITGQDSNSELVLDGLLISGADVVLAGSFRSVTLHCCTLDPGNAAGGSADIQNTADPNDLYAQSVDERDLLPCHLWIQATIDTLTLDRCITGPIRTQFDGTIGTLMVNDSIIQGIPTSDLTQPLQPADLLDQRAFASALRDQSPLSLYLQGKLAPLVLQGLQEWDGKEDLNPTLVDELLLDLNAVLQTNFYTTTLFKGIPLDPDTATVPGPTAPLKDLIQFNRELLEAAFPVALAQAAIALSTGEANLSRTTVLGRMFVHRLEASECILDDFAVVEDSQHGCVRFTAWSMGSVIPRQYESVPISEQSAIFTSREFGEPGYGQLLASADLAILQSNSVSSPPADNTTPTGGSSILQGAQDGSEMGAFAREKNPIKERSILIKYQEYMPLGLAPVLIRVT
jgi:hypothetical protein